MEQVKCTYSPPCFVTLLCKKSIVTGCIQNVSWTNVRSRDRRTPRWSRDGGTVKSINKSATCNYSKAAVVSNYLRSKRFPHFTADECFNAVSISCATFKWDNRSNTSGQRARCPVDLLTLTPTCSERTIQN